MKQRIYVSLRVIPTKLEWIFLLRATIKCQNNTNNITSIANVKPIASNDSCFFTMVTCSILRTSHWTTIKILDIVGQVCALNELIFFSLFRKAIARLSISFFHICMYLSLISSFLLDSNRKKNQITQYFISIISVFVYSERNWNQIYLHKDHRVKWFVQFNYNANMLTFIIMNEKKNWWIWMKCNKIIILKMLKYTVIRKIGTYI